MDADIIINDQTLEFQGEVIVKADTTEMKVVGGLAGYAFQDRSNSANRYVLYASKNVTRLWQDGVGDILKITNGEIETTQGLSSYCFHDRSNPENRFVLYASNGKIGFWNKRFGDVLKIDSLSGSIICKYYENALGMPYTYPEQTVEKKTTISSKEGINHGMGGVITKDILVKDTGKPIGHIDPREIKLSKELDLVHTILDLQKRVAELEKRIANITNP